MSTNSYSIPSVYISMRLDVDWSPSQTRREAAELQELLRSSTVRDVLLNGCLTEDNHLLRRVADLDTPFQAVHVTVLLDSDRKREGRVQRAMRKHDTDDTVTPPATDEVRMDPRLVRRSGDDGTWVVQDQHTRIT